MGSAAATSKSATAVGFYCSDFTKGIADEGPKHLSTHGYSYNIYSDASVSKFKSALTNDDVIFVHSHGAAGLFTLSPSVYVYGNQIASAITDADGIHRFNSIVVYKLVGGYSIYSALFMAKTQIFDESEKYWGADSYIIYGSGSTTIN